MIKKDFEVEARERDLRMMRYLLRTMEHYEIPARKLYEDCAMSSKTFSNLKHLTADGAVTKGGNGVCRSIWSDSLAA